METEKQTVIEASLRAVLGGWSTEELIREREAARAELRVSPGEKLLTQIEYIADDILRARMEVRA